MSGDNLTSHAIGDAIVEGNPALGPDRAAELNELIDMELNDILAAAGEQGYSQNDVLKAIAHALAERRVNSSK